MHEDNLIQALEFISEGQSATLPRRLSREAFSTQSFMLAAETVRKKSRDWTQGPVSLEDEDIGLDVSIESL